MSALHLRTNRTQKPSSNCGRKYGRTWAFSKTPWLDESTLAELSPWRTSRCCPTCTGRKISARTCPLGLLLSPIGNAFLRDQAGKRSLRGKDERRLGYTSANHLRGTQSLTQLPYSTLPLRHKRSKG